MIVPTFNLHGIEAQNFLFRVRIHIVGLILRHTSICKTALCYLYICNSLCFIRWQIVNVGQVNGHAQFTQFFHLVAILVILVEHTARVLAVQLARTIKEKTREFLIFLISDQLEG